MKNFLFYLNIQFKRILKLLPTFLIVSVISLSVIGSVFFVFIGNSADVKAQKKFIVGITGEELAKENKESEEAKSKNLENSYLNIGVKAIQKMDYSSSYIDLKVIEEKDAKELLSNGEIMAYIIIPEGFIESVNYGRNDKQIVFVSGTGNQDIVDIIKGEITQIVSSYVTNVQSSIYSTQKIIRKSDKRRDLDKYTIDMNIKFIDYVMKRNSFAQVKIIGNSNGSGYKITRISYYFCGVIVFFLMLSGMNCVSFFSNRNMQLGKILYSKGVNAFFQVSAEIVAYLFFIFIFTAFLFLTLFFLLKFGAFSIIEWKFYSISLEMLLFFLKSIPVMILAGTFQYFIFESVKNVVAQVSFQFVIFFFLCYFSGCFYPSEFFPQIVQKIFVHLPVGVAFNYMQKVLVHSENSLTLCEIFLYIFAFVSISVLVRRKKLNEC